MSGWLGWRFFPPLNKIVGFVLGVTASVFVLAQTTPETVTLTAVADSYADTSSYNNYGRLQFMQAGQGHNAYLRFDLSSFKDRQIVSARLELQSNAAFTVAPVLSHVLDNSWDEYGLTWFNRPYNVVADVGALPVVNTAGTWTGLDVTTAVSLTKGRPLSFQIAGTNTPVAFATHESSNPPRLIVSSIPGDTTTPPQPPISSVPLKVGINLEAPSYYATEVPFVDLMKQAHTWYTQCKPWRDSACSQFSRPGGSSWDTLEQDLLQTDRYGWVSRLPSATEGTTTGVNYTSVATLLPTGLSARFPSGRFVVLYEGEGSLSYRISNTTLTRNAGLSGPGKDVLDVVSTAPSKMTGSSMLLSVESTDPNQTGNYLRNIRVFPPGGVCSNNATRYCSNEAGGPVCSSGGVCQNFADVYTSRPFHPKFLANIRRFDTIRFMGFQGTNDASKEANWRDRTLPSHYTWARTGYHQNPVEIIVKLGNTLKRNIWINVPHRATDDYIRKLATLVHRRLNPNIKVYVEYSNEIWNTVFSAGSWVEKQGLAAWPDAPETAYVKRLQWQGVRTAQMCDIWAEVWGADANRVNCVAGVQPGNAWSAGYVLDCPLYAVQHGGVPCYTHHVRGVAVAPYFGGYIGDYSHKTELESWATDTDGGLTRLFTEIFSGGQIANGPAGGALASAKRALDLSIGFARDRGLETYSYEGGQHLVGVGATLNSPAVTAMFTQANRDPRMGQAYRTYLEGWRGSGASLFSQWTSVGTYSSWGSWGLLEYRDQLHSPKFDAVQQFLSDIGQ